jgi:hypothetical protein
MSVAFGAIVHGEFSSSDASGLSEVNSRFALYGGGATTALTLGTNDVVYVTGLIIACGSSPLTVSIYDGANNVVDAGEMIARATLAGGTTSVIDWTQSPHKCQLSSYPKVKTSGAGQIDVVLNGTINREQET